MTMVMLFLATYVAAAFIGGPPVYILFFGLVESIRDVCGYDKDDPFVKWTLLGVCIQDPAGYDHRFDQLCNGALRPHV